MNGNWLFYTFNHLVFDVIWLLKKLKLKIGDFILKNRNIFQNICEENLKFIFKIWEKIESGKSLEIMAFSDLMKLNICFYISLDQ